MTEKVTPWQWTAAVLIVVLQALDTYTTIVGINLGAREANPISGFFLSLGVVPFIIMKAVTTLFIAFLATVTKYVVWVLILICAYVVVSNFNVLLNLGWSW